MTDKEDVANSEKLLTNETENVQNEMEEKENGLKLNEEDDFKGYSKFSKFLLFFFIFLDWYYKSSWNNFSYEWWTSP